jgi:MoaA/NifB/PqqE/SkfB family radical SAM enzyme
MTRAIRINTPYYTEVEDMIEFCRKCKSIYIFGCAENQEYLLKFLDCSNIHVNGYVVSFADNRKLKYRNIPVLTLDEISSCDDVGILLGLSEFCYEDVIPELRKKGLQYLRISDHTKVAITKKLRPKPREEFQLQIDLCSHCNLNCQMCCHFSPIAGESYLNIDVFSRDMKRIAYLSGNYIGDIVLVGGEPLLHKDINKFIEISRKLFPCCRLVIITNGLLLINIENTNKEFWSICHENDVELTITVYPINLDI